MWTGTGVCRPSIVDIASSACKVMKRRHVQRAVRGRFYELSIHLDSKRSPKHEEYMRRGGRGSVKDVETSSVLGRVVFRTWSYRKDEQWPDSEEELYV